MEDKSERALRIINEVNASGETYKIEDPAMLDLIYNELKDLQKRGIISEEVAMELQELPKDKVFLAHEQIMKLLGDSSI